MTFEKNIELLTNLRNEIERIGIQDAPSKTQYNLLRDKKSSPASSTVLSKLDMTWSQVMQILGYRYDGITLEKDIEYIRDDFPEMTFNQKMNYMNKKIESIGLTLNGWYSILNIIDEGQVKNLTATVSKREKYVDGSFKSMPKDDQINYLVNYLNDKGIKNSVEYNKIREKEKTPSLSYINSNFGGWKNITKVYTKKFGKDLGQ